MRKALTVGELLVTMAIIGCVSMLVLPGFIRDYNNRVYCTKLKKVMELLEVAVHNACIDKEVSYYWQTGYTSFYGIRNYFNSESTRNEDKFATEYRAINGSNTVTTADIEDGFQNNSYILNSGEALNMIRQADGSFIFYIDINGTQEPNIGGRDMFLLYFDPKTNLFTGGDASKCLTSPLGDGCVQKIIDSNWELKY